VVRLDAIIILSSRSSKLRILQAPSTRQSSTTFLRNALSAQAENFIVTVAGQTFFHPVLARSPIAARGICKFD